MPVSSFWNPIEVTDPELLQKILILKVTNSYIVFNKLFKETWPK
jgi:hypothetical protein